MTNTKKLTAAQKNALKGLSKASRQARYSLQRLGLVEWSPETGFFLTEAGKAALEA